MVTLVLGSQNTTDNTCRIKTLCVHADEPKSISFQLPHQKTMLHKDTPLWLNYVKGVLAYYNGPLYPFKCLIVSSLPVGAGLSSSASLEAATYMFLDSLAQDGLPTDGALQEGHYESIIKKIIVCYNAEHFYADVPCGIMDQFIAFMGKEYHALLLDCRSRNYSLHKVQQDKALVLVINSHVRHQLGGSEYSVRRQECLDAAQIMGHYNLRTATLEDLEEFKSKMDFKTYQRAHHVITEIQRTLEAADALEKQDYATFGRLMKESHESLRDDFEVSCSELDELVDIACKVKGVFGARMTGAGFGGCAVALVQPHAVNILIENIKKSYSGPITPEIYVVPPSCGAGKFCLDENQSEVKQ